VRAQGRGARPSTRDAGPALDDVTSVLSIRRHCPVQPSDLLRHGSGECDAGVPESVRQASFPSALEVIRSRRGGEASEA